MGKYKSRKFSGSVLVFIFLSGVSAIVYQVIWIREFTLVFGVHVLSASTVLASFMAGLALGSFFGGKLADRKIHPLLLFTLIEAGIGIYALLHPYLFKGLIAFYTRMNNVWEPGPWSLQFFRFGCAFTLLLIPTSLMGGTLPALSKFYVEQLKHLGNRFSLLYGANNLGAVVGGFLAGFILIAALGMQVSLLAAAILNLLNAAGALVLFNLIRGQSRYFELQDGLPEPPGDTEPGNQKTRRIHIVLLWIFAIEGFTTLSYEIIWTRMLLEFSFDKTVYFFSTILISFIAGLALGSLLYSRRADKPRNNYALLAAIEILIGVTSLLAFILFCTISPLLVAVRDQTDSWMLVSGKEYIIMFVLLLCPATLMGVTFPLVSKICNNNLKLVGSRIGFLGFLDTTGSIVGSFAAGFILIRFMGIYTSFVFTAYLNIMAGVVIISLLPDMKRRKKLALTMVSAFFPMLMILFFNQDNYIESKLAYFPDDRIETYLEGGTSTVTVHKQSDGYRALAINGAKTAYSNPDDLRVHRLLAYLPYFFKPDAEKAFVIGFGLGVTAATFVECDIPQVAVAELAPEVIRVSAGAFSYLNDDILAKKKLDVHVEDGRSMLSRSKTKFDIISSNAVHARLGANLYTYEFYEVCRQKLTPEGILCQWIPTNWLSSKDFRSLIRACTDVFPNTSLWYITRSHTLLLASNQPHNISYEVFSNLFRKANREYQLTDVDIHNVDVLIGSLLATTHELLAYSGEAVRNTDNFPIVEFSMVVDQKPNTRVLADLSSLSIDYERVMKSTEGRVAGDSSVMVRIRDYNFNFRKSMKEFADLFPDSSPSSPLYHE